MLARDGAGAHNLPCEGVEQICLRWLRENLRWREEKEGEEKRVRRLLDGALAFCDILACKEVRATLAIFVLLNSVVA